MSSVFSVAQKRAYLYAVITRPTPNGQESSSALLSELRSLRAGQRRTRIEQLDEATLDRLISDHIREMSRHITQRFAEEPDALQIA